MFGLWQAINNLVASIRRFASAIDSCSEQIETRDHWQVVGPAVPALDVEPETVEPVNRVRSRNGKPVGSK